MIKIFVRFSRNRTNRLISHRVEEPRDFMPGYIMYKGQDIIHYIEMVKKGIDSYKEERDTLVKKMFEMKDRYCGAKVLLERINEDWNGKVFKK